MNFTKTILSRITNGASLSRFIGLILLVFLLGIRIADPVFISNLRNQSFDVLQRMHPRPSVQLPVAIVDIDENSLEKYGQWPWPRTRVAELVDKMTALGAVTIGFDIIFAEADRLSPDKIALDNPNLPSDIRDAMAALPSNEQSLVDAFKRSRVVVGETSAREGQTTRSETTETSKRKIPQVPSANLGADPTPFLSSYPRLVQNIESISEAAAGRGVFSVIPDPDGVIRRVPLVVLAEGQKRLALSTEILRIATGGKAFAIKTDHAGISSVVVGGVEVPTDSNASIWPWFNASTRDRYVAAGDVLSGADRAKTLAGKMVLVGTSAVGLEDYRATPIASSMPGVEIHAQVIENILSKTFLLRPNYALGMEILFLAGIGLLMIVFLPRIGAVYSAITAVLVLGGFSAATLWAFYSHRLLIDGIFPVIALAVLFMVMATANYIREEMEKRQIRGAFGQYLSPALVSQLAENPEMLSLGGETIELSVLFTDIRGFTGISESYKKNPQGLTRLMNRFLNTLSEPILGRSGTIDKYMGDAIMAFWNAPIAVDGHAEKACLSALKMIDNLNALNEARRQEWDESSGQPLLEFKIGIGINTGECVVGNMGSDLRFDYTALGDTVNLASRLEGQSKNYGVEIILGDKTAKAVKETMATIEIDLIQVKGKTEPERIHALLGGAEFAANEDFVALRAMNAMMLSAYHGKDWTAALNALEEIRIISERLGTETVTETYLFMMETRISEFMANPPGTGWNGVYEATSK
ncbi:MAG: adenylate/guanylate cyclase domain-containing protein [Salaquimonas sp.]